MEMRNEKIKSFFDELTKSEIQELFRNAQQDEVIRSVPLLNRMDEESQSFSTFWLHARIKRDCYFFCSTYIYHVWITTDKAGKEKIEVEEISLRVRRNSGSVDYSRKKNNINQYKHVEEVYGTGNVLGGTILTATAKLFGNIWNVEVKL